MNATVVNHGLAAPSPGGDAPRNDALRHAAQEFEAIFLAQVLGASRSGGIGVADAVLREMLKAQEVA